MKKQIVVIHGGEMHASYKAYIASLKAQHIDADWLLGKSKNWKHGLSKSLGPSYEIIAPRMPSQFNAQYLEWKIWFGKMVPHLAKEVVLVGHSLGGIFLAKYLSEHSFPKKIRGLFLVAAPFDDKAMGEPMYSFKLPKNLGRLKALGDKVHVYQSEDDDIVPPGNTRGYAKALPEAKVYIFRKRGHFFDEKFPELVADIKGLYMR